MTNKEAIARLKEGAPFSEIYDKEYEEAISLAIKALEFTDDFFHESFNSYLNGVFGNYVEGDAE